MAKPPGAKPTAKKPQAQPRPGVEVGDELYVHHAGQPCTCRVAAHGQHGVTAEIGGAHHKIGWDKVLGHKSRVAIKGAIVDEGEDGMILQDQHGRRRFVAVPNESKEDPLVIAKAFDPRRPVLLFKGGPLANRPGLTQREITDKRGVVSKRWVRLNPEEKHPREPAKKKPPEGARGAQYGYGTHNLGEGDRVHFAAGEFKGSGTIVGQPGADGAHVKDESGRVHQVRWAEVTGHEKDRSQKPKVDGEVLGSHEPVHPDQFNAAEYGQSHDDAKVTPDAILAHFPPDTKQKIEQVQQRLASIEQTIDHFCEGEGYTAERQQLHREIMVLGRNVMHEGKQEFRPGFLSAERVKAATPAAGEKPQLIVLGGRGGSGKSWFKGNVYDPNKFIVLDADAIKEMMPEYEGWNAAQVHEESGELFDKIADSARAMGLNVVLDATLKTTKSAVKRIEAFKGAGYEAHGHYMFLPRQEAAKRAVSRFLGKTHRYVPVDVVLSNTTNEHTFEELKPMFDSWSFRDNNVPQGEQPKLISQSGSDQSGEGAAAPDKNGRERPLTKSDQGGMILLWTRKR